jgi:hypothetical protein
MTSKRIMPAAALAAFAIAAPGYAADPAPPVPPAAGAGAAATGSGAASPAAAEPAEVEALRREVQALRDEVEGLKARLESLAASGTAAPATAAAAAAAPPVEVAPAPAVVAAPAPPPVAGGPTRSQNLMNPAISAVFQAIGSSTVNQRQESDGFDLSEAELALESTVDPYAKMNLYLSFPAQGTPEVEEGYVTTLTLPASLQLKGGRFKSAYGKWNTLHTHAFFTVERPDVLVNFFGEESLTNDGLSLSWLIPNPWGLYLDSITEAGTARESVDFNSASRAPTWTEHLAAFFNTSANSSLETGLSAVGGRTGPTETLQSDIAGAGLSGTLEPDTRLDSLVTGIDLTWKWKPLQQNTYHSLLWQTEALRSRRDVQVLEGAALAYDHVTSGGGYTYFEGQWTKRWKAGVRYDLTGFPDSTTDRESAVAGVLKFIPSEFQELRFEVKHTRYNEGASARFDGRTEDTQIYFEWIPVIGAHGAHKY